MFPNNLIRASALLALFAATVVHAQTETSTVVALRFPGCRGVPNNLQVRVGDRDLDAEKQVVNGQTYWVAPGAKAFDISSKPIEVSSDGVPIFCGNGGEADDLAGIGQVGVFTISCKMGWLLEISSKPAAAFKYVRGSCEGENAGPTQTLLLDVRKDEVIKVALRGLDRKPLREVDVTRTKIDEEGQRGAWTLKGAELLNGDVHAPIENKKIAAAYAKKFADQYLGGLEEVCFRVK
jgi:hypothetical protein